jgi:hypothetical protein
MSCLERKEGNQYLKKLKTTSTGGIKHFYFVRFTNFKLYKKCIRLIFGVSRSRVGGLIGGFVCGVRRGISWAAGVGSSGLVCRWLVLGGVFGLSVVFDVGDVSAVVVGLVGDRLGPAVGQEGAVRAGHVALVIGRLLVGIVVVGVVVLYGPGEVVGHCGLPKSISFKKGQNLNCS